LLDEEVPILMKSELYLFDSIIWRTFGSIKFI